MTSLSVALAAEQLRRRVPGGIGTYALGLLKGIGEMTCDARPDVTIVASRSPIRPDPLARLGYPIAHSWLPGPVMTRSWDLGLLRAGRGADVVHAVSLAAPAAFSGVPLVVMVHDVAWRSMPEAYPARGRRWHEAALRRVAARADVVIVPSEETGAAVLAARVGISDHRIVVVPEGADHLPAPDHAAAQALLERLNVTGPYLLTVSTLEPRKNLARLVEAYALAKPKLAGAWPLVVVGPEGWGLSASPARTSPSDAVVFAGEVDDGALASVYQQARCCAYVPIVEGFGLPVVEAMAQGTPVVSSPVPSAGGASLEVDPTDVPAIAEGLVAAACDEATRAALVAAGRARAATLRWVSTAAAHVVVWERAVGEGRPRR